MESARRPATYTAQFKENGNDTEWCDYAERWISIKAKYDLSVNEQEKEALDQMLNTCTGS